MTTKKNTRDEMTIPGALMHIADALGSIATQLKYLGTGDAGTSMGAIEAHAVMVREAFGEVASSIENGLMAIANEVDRK